MHWWRHVLNFLWSLGKSKYLIVKGRNNKPDNKTVLYNYNDLYSSQDALHLGHNISTAKNDSLFADATAKL